VRVAILGLGEAGSRFASDLVDAGVAVAAYDPAPVATPSGVTRCDRPADAVAGADIVLSLTVQKDAARAMDATLDAVSESAIYADLSTSAPALKRDLAARAAARGVAFADVALMKGVPAFGLRTPAIASGTGAERYAGSMGGLGVPVDFIGEVAGEASTRKLLRSVMMKGLAALVIEAVRAADAADLSEWLWSELVAEITAADEALLARLVHGTGRHAVRRIDEMEAAVALLDSLGVEPVMTKATVERLRRVARDGVPDVPAPASQPKS
jgi:3-hydroxyisobutyrate dehydrogenase-like beta-hydroxyacid dehydrogenase